MVRAKGEGTVYQRADGRWVAQLDLGVDRETGRRRRPTRVRKSKKAAAEALAQLRREMRVAAASGAVTLEQWCAQWLDDCAERVRAGTMAPRTAVGYESDVRRHIRPAVGHVRLDRLAPGHVQRMMTGMQAAGLSPRTAAAARGTLSAALSAAVADGLIEVNVARAARPPTRTTRNPSAFSDAEMAKIAAACQQHRLGTAFVFSALTGLRTSELIGLQWAHVDLEQGTYQVVEGLHRIGPRGAAALGLDAGVHASRPKTAGSGDATPLSPAAVEVLGRQRRQQAADQLAAGRWVESGRVFTTTIGTALDADNLRKQWRQLLEDAQVDTHTRSGSGRGLHELRRTFASRLRDRGVPIEDVQRLGRWSSPAMLLAHYRAVDDDRLRRAAGEADEGVAW